MSQAAGLIETLGYPAAITAADAAVKSAWVTLESIELAKGGLVTVIVRGDVAAVQAAVAAGSEAGSRIGKVISSHVIPRPIDGLCGSLWTPGPIGGQPACDISSKAAAAEKAPADEPAQVEPEVTQPEPEAVIESAAEDIQPVETAEEMPAEEKNVQAVIEQSEDGEQPITEDYLRSQKTVKLRQMARSFEDFSMSRNEIKFAKKNQLVEAILDYLQR